jgi:hypothetical protein
VIRTLFNKISMWFGNLSGPKKVAAVVVAVATGVSAVVGAVNASIALYEKLGERSRAANPLELVDVGFTQVRQKGDSFAAIDFKVANLGESPVIIERADMRVEKIWTLKAPYVSNPNEPCYGAGLLPSFNYDVELPTKGAPYRVPTSLSQTIEPNGTDRFTITLQRKERTAKSGEDYVFLVTASLIYGVENNVVTSPDVLYGENEVERAGALYSYDRGGGCYVPKQDTDRITKQNKRAVAEIRRIEAPRNEALEDLLQKVS